MSNSIIERIDWKKQSLLPVVVQDSSSKQVLMLAYMNQESLRLSLDTNKAHYFSRSKERIWMKGESSGHTQTIKRFLLDCDSDTLLIEVEQKGVACHTGRESCFFTELKSGDTICDISVDVSKSYDIIDRLYHTIQERKSADKSSSWTATLLKSGDNAILKKVIEESGELCFAIKDSNEQEIIHESADLLYHVLVALASQDISPDRVKQELERRSGTSGIAEKQSRSR